MSSAKETKKQKKMVDNLQIYFYGLFICLSLALLFHCPLLFIAIVKLVGWRVQSNRKKKIL